MRTIRATRSDVQGIVMRSTTRVALALVAAAVVVAMQAWGWSDAAQALAAGTSWLWRRCWPIGRVTILPIAAALVLYGVTSPAARRFWRRWPGLTASSITRWGWLLLGLAGLVALGGMALLAPRWMVAHDTVISKLSEEQYGKAISDARTAVLQAVGGLLLAAGAVATWRQVRIGREVQITERFTRAVDQLGSDKPDVRLGGVYALERIARDSRPDRAAITGVLSAFVQEHTPWPPRTDAGQPPAFPEETARTELPPLQARVPDAHAAVNALGRLRRLEGVSQIDLSRTDLRRVRLEGSLQGANLIRATLQFAALAGIDLRDAWLNWADLREALLNGADLQGAALADADLRKALLTGANLREAVLTGADLREAVLASADLRGAILQDAKLQQAVMDTRTRWPDDFDPVAAGVRLSRDYK
jgi:Pentapeptide repeats (8 copies)